MTISRTPVKDSLVVFTEGAKVNFKLFGFVAPVFGCNINGEPRLVPVKIENQADKEKFRQQILAMIADGSLSEFVFVSEAWMVSTSDPQEAKVWLAEHGSLEGFPGRREAVQVFYCSANEEICYTAWIERGSIPATLSEWEVQTRSGHFTLPDLETRFQGLFAQGKAGNN
jgi:hypothetical protein